MVLPRRLRQLGASKQEKQLAVSVSTCMWRKYVASMDTLMLLYDCARSVQQRVRYAHRSLNDLVDIYSYILF